MTMPSSTRQEVTQLLGDWSGGDEGHVEPVFLDQEHAIDYAQSRASFRSGEIRLTPRSDTNKATA
jgi:hypothetical protein